jgi:serine phosphatase RsbU (regulator of sigma subunit)
MLGPDAPGEATAGRAPHTGIGVRRERREAAVRARRTPRTGAWRPARLAVVVTLAALALTGATAWVCAALYDSNETRLLRSRTREVGVVLTEVIPTVQTPLASAAALADATGGSVPRFRRFLGPYVGRGREFVSATLWAPGATAPRAVIGVAPALGASQPRARRFRASAERVPKLVVTLTGSQRSARLVYAYSAPGTPHGYVVSAESALAPTRRAAPSPHGSPFSDLDFALYLGRAQRQADLLSTNIPRLPIPGRHVVETVAFGNNELTIAVAARDSLGGSFFAALPWIIAGAGFVLALAAGLLTERLVRRRAAAEALASRLERSAAEIRRLYTEQREIAQTLQAAILPEALPETPGVQAYALYEPGTSGVEVGGDWYDLTDVGGGRLVGVVGDVSGRGLRAATTMATLRTAAFAYAAQDSRPSSVLARLAALVARQPHSYFATVLCVRIDVDARELTLASAGHLPPLLIQDEHAAFISVPVGVPVGAASDASYTEVRATVPPGSTLLAFTDGLVERRGEVIDDGLERLRTLSLGGDRLPLEDLVQMLAQRLTSPHSHDDVAILALRWQS